MGDHHVGQGGPDSPSDNWTEKSLSPQSPPHSLGAWGGSEALPSPELACRPRASSQRPVLVHLAPGASAHLPSLLFSEYPAFRKEGGQGWLEEAVEAIWWMAFLPIVQIGS